MFACPATDDFFRARIDQMIDLRHPLAVLASRMPWQEIEARVAHLFVRKAHAGVAMPDLDLFGEKPPRQASGSKAGRPRIALRVMISLLYLKHAFNESDEGVVSRWADTPRWQFFSGQSYYEDRLPCDATTLVKFRKLLGEEGVEELLAQTINVAVELKLIKPQELSRVIVDSTVQEKASSCADKPDAMPMPASSSACAAPLNVSEPLWAVWGSLLAGAFFAPEKRQPSKRMSGGIGVVGVVGEY